MKSSNLIKDKDIVIIENTRARKIMMKLESLTALRYKTVVKAYKVLVDKKNKVISIALNKELILENLGKFEVFFITADEDEVSIFIDEQEAAMTSMLIHLFLANTNIIDYENFRDTNHSSRNKLSGQKTLKEYMNICRDNIEKFLIQFCNTSHKRANRIATKAAKAIKHNLPPNN